MSMAEKHFSRAADSYASLAAVQKKIAAALIQEIPDGFIRGADLGSGPGVNFAALRGKAKSIIGIDISPAMTARAAETGVPDTRAVTGDIENIPLPGDSCDLIFSSMAIQWCRPERAFREIRRISRNGAFIALAIPVAGTLKELSQDLEKAGIPGRCMKFRSLAEIAPLLDECGITGKAASPVSNGIITKERVFQAKFTSIRAYLDSIRKIGASGVSAKPMSREARRRLFDVLQERLDRDALVHTYKTAFILGYLEKQSAEKESPAFGITAAKLGTLV